MTFNNNCPTFPSAVLFSTHSSSEGFTAGVPDAGTGGIPGGKSIPGGGGKLLIGGGRKGGLWSQQERWGIQLSAISGFCVNIYKNTIAYSTWNIQSKADCGPLLTFSSKNTERKTNTRKKVR